MRTVIVIAAALVLAACGQTETAPPAPAAEASLGLAVENAWAAPMPAGVDVAAGYMTITNPGDADDQLIAASSPRAASVEVHEMIMDGAVMRMRAMESLAIPAHGGATLEPGGMHLMFMGVSEPFAIGDEIPVTLTFANAGEVQVSLPVRAPAVSGMGDTH